MAIEKLPEFSKNGQKNTDKLVLEDGFPVNLKPARQWFNFLFNQLSLSINQIIDENYIQHSEIIDNLTSPSADKPLSAKQGKVLQDTKQPNLGFIPIRQGTGSNQLNNIVHIGWLGDSLGVQVDGVGFNDVWPINIENNAGTATKLQTARNIELSGAVSGSANFDGSGNINIGVSLQVGLGVNQWWQNVTASRAINTSYYNGTGNPIMVNVGFDDTDSRSPTITIVVGGVTIIDQRYDGGGNYGVGQYCFIVPNGTYYSVNNTTVNSHKIWSELR